MKNKIQFQCDCLVFLVIWNEIDWVCAECGTPIELVENKDLL